ncbi:MAG: hypothetical protein V3S16_12115 [Candidatus Desulfatibia sp.]|uniref:hypothetical protein n=1 Tax=Candidatus Desulfatibia sp. TaxID=3101189 RepID=UPI002F31D4E8
MPVVIVRVEHLGSGASESFYSPSTCIHDFIKKGESYTVADFRKRMLEGLKKANRLVVDKYGYACFGCDIEIMKVEKLPENENKSQIKVMELKP